jgi:hypothetical protein
MEINVRAMPTTSLPGLSYERLWQRERPIMPSVSSLLVYFGFFSRGEFLTAPPSGLPIRRSTSIKQSLFYHAIVTCLVLILIVGAVGLSVSSRPHVSKSSTITSTPTVSATPPVSSDSPSSRTLPVNLLFLSLYRRCPDYSYSLAHQEVDPQQQGQSCNPACKALQTEG